MKTLKYLLGLSLLLTLASCKKDQYYLFNDVVRIQFGPDKARIYQTTYNLADTLKAFTFYYEDESVKEDTVFFDIYAIGGVAKQDRNFILEQEQVPNAVNAIPGTDYLAFNDPRATKNFVIKAGEVHTKVPIILLRNSSLKSKTATLKFNVAVNENFQLGERNNLWRKIMFTDRLSQPSAWDANGSRYYYGTYSVTKHQFMIETTGLKWDQEFMATLPSDYALLQYYLGVLKTALIDYNKAHPGSPMKDESGELVLFP